MEPNTIQDNNNQPAQPIMPKQKKQIPTWVVFSAIVLFVAVVFGGVFTWQYFTENKSYNLIGNSRLSQNCKDNIVPEIAGLAYDEARIKIISAGWTPFQTLADNSSDIQFFADIWAKGYHEVDACSGTGEASCRYGFKDKCNNILYVVTIGYKFPPAGVVKESWVESMPSLTTEIIETSYNGPYYQMGGAYNDVKEHLKQQGWVPVVPNSYEIESGTLSSTTTPIVAKFPKISHCGSGRDAVCSVAFKNGSKVIVFYLSQYNGMWVVIGSDHGK